MAIFHYSQKPVARGRGQSAVAGAAYRAADKLYDHRVGQWFDYERRRGVVHTEIVLPTEAAKRDINWARNRQQLWNAAEAAERRKDSRVAREHEVALPHELQKEQHIALLRAFAGEIANRYQVAVDFALHKPHRQGDARNFHAHVYATTRQVGPTGLGDKASIELSNTDRAKRGLVASKVEITAMRARWGELVNEHLALRGIEARVDHRSLKAQGDRAHADHASGAGGHGDGAARDRDAGGTAGGRAAAARSPGPARAGRRARAPGTRAEPDREVDCGFIRGAGRCAAGA